MLKVNTELLKNSALSRTALLEVAFSRTYCTSKVQQLMESLHLLYPKYVLKYFALSTIFIMSPVPSNQSIILTVDNNSTNNCFFFLFQGDFPSTALKTLISVSTLVLLGLIIAYHSLEVQVTKAVFIYISTYYSIKTK